MSLLSDAGRGHDAAAPLGVQTDRPPRLFIVAVIYLPRGSPDLRLILPRRSSSGPSGGGIRYAPPPGTTPSFAGRSPLAIGAPGV